MLGRESEERDMEKLREKEKKSGFHNKRKGGDAVTCRAGSCGACRENDVRDDADDSRSRLSPGPQHQSFTGEGEPTKQGLLRINSVWREIR